MDVRPDGSVGVEPAARTDAGDARAIRTAVVRRGCRDEAVRR